MNNTYDANTLVRLTLNTTNTTTGNPLDATTVTVSIMDESRTITDLSTSIVHDGVGAYHLDFIPPGHGDYTCYWVCTGNVQGTKTKEFYVKRPFEV